MLKRLAAIVVFALSALSATLVPTSADQLLSPDRTIEGRPSSGDILLGTLKLGRRQSGRTILTPDMP